MKSSYNIEKAPENGGSEGFIESIEFYNWGGHGNERIRMGNSLLTAITGDNGSGKTCLVDAIKAVFCLDNQFYYVKQEGKRRDIREYISDNNKEQKAGISLVIRNRKPYSDEKLLSTDDKFVTLTRIMNIGTAGQITHRYFITPGSHHLKPFLFKEEGATLAQTLKDMKSIEHNQTNYLQELARFQLEKTSIGSLFMEQGDLEKIITPNREKGGLIENILEITGNKHIIDDQKATLIKQRAAEDEQRKMEEKLKIAQIDLQENSSANYNYQNAYNLAEKIKALQKTYDHALAFECLNDLQDRKQKLETLERKCEEYKANLKSDQELLADRAALFNEYKATQVNRREELGVAEEKLRNLQDAELKLKIEKQMIEKQISEIEKMSGDPAELNIEIEKMYEGLNPIAQERKGIETKIQEETGILAGLNNSKKPSKPIYVSNFLREVLKMIPEDKILVFCDVINITDPKWVQSVEGLLGNLRYAMLVDPSYSEIAYKIAEKLKYRPKIFEQKLSVLKEIRHPVSNKKTELGSHVSAHPTVKDFIAGILQAECYEDVESARLGIQKNNRPAITHQAYYFNLFRTKKGDVISGQSVSPDFLSCGGESINQQIEELNLSLSKEKTALEKIIKHETALRNTLKQLQAKLTLLNRKAEIPQLIEKIAENDVLFQKNKEKELGYEQEVSKLKCELDLIEKQIEQDNEDLWQIRHEIDEYQIKIENCKSPIAQHRAIITTNESILRDLREKYGWQEEDTEKIIAGPHPEKRSEEYKKELDFSIHDYEKIDARFKGHPIDMIEELKKTVQNIEQQYKSLVLETETTKRDVAKIIEGAREDIEKYKTDVGKLIQNFRKRFKEIVSIINTETYADIEYIQPDPENMNEQPFGYVKLLCSPDGRKRDNNMKMTGGSSHWASIAFALSGITIQQEDDNLFPFLVIDEPFEGVSEPNQQRLIKTFVDTVRKVRSQIIYTNPLSFDASKISCADKKIIATKGFDEKTGHNMPFTVEDDREKAVNVSRERAVNAVKDQKIKVNKAFVD